MHAVVVVVVATVVSVFILSMAIMSIVPIFGRGFHKSVVKGCMHVRRAGISS